MLAKPIRGTKLLQEIVNVLTHASPIDTTSVNTERSPAKKQRLLIVEDNDINQQVVSDTAPNRGL